MFTTEKLRGEWLKERQNLAKYDWKAMRYTSAEDGSKARNSGLQEIVKTFAWACIASQLNALENVLETLHVLPLFLRHFNLRRWICWPVSRRQNLRTNPKNIDSVGYGNTNLVVTCRTSITSTARSRGKHQDFASFCNESCFNHPHLQNLPISIYRRQLLRYLNKSHL